MSYNDEPLVRDFDLSLVANFAHQIINPLNGVAGTLDRLAEGKIKEEHRKIQRLRAARAQVEQCVALTRNLAYLAIGFGAIRKEDKKTIVIPQNLIEAAMFFQEHAEKKGISIEVIDRDIQNKVSGHPDLIRQVFMNIMDNSVKYSKKDSTIVVKHWIQKTSSVAMIEVISVPEVQISRVDISKVFEFGFRGANAKQIVASGTGLGLFICERIVSVGHNGAISADVYERNKIRLGIRLPGGEIGESDKRFRQ